MPSLHKVFRSLNGQHVFSSFPFSSSFFRHFFAGVLMCVFVLLNVYQATGQNAPLVQNDFEDGTLQGWIPRGGSVSLTNTTEAAHGGTHSLKTTGRTAGFNGPSLNVVGTLTVGTIYQVTAWVRLVPGQTADNLKITMQRTPTGGSTTFDQVAASQSVTDAGWVMLQGQYSFAADVAQLLLYIEGAAATTEYYVDDFSIIQVPAHGCAIPQDNSGIHSNFEDGTRQGWGPRIGRETVTVTSADQHGGTFSLLTTGRQATFDGTSINAAGKLCNGSQYTVSLWAKLAPGEPDTQLRVSLQRSLAGTTNFNTVIGNTLVTANQWVHLQALYSFGFNYDSLSLYVESGSGTPSFYIDDVDITFVPPIQIEHDIPSVFQTLADFFPVGGAIGPGDIVGAHGQLLAKHFNSLTSGNDMKFDATEPTEGHFVFTNADAEVAFAQTNNMRIRGHTLVWHSQFPAWLFQDASGNPLTPTPENKALLLQRLTNHIQGVVSHFGNKIYAWDVVNEVIDESQPDGFRRSQWFNIAGPDYIDTAFRVAHQVAPDAKLYINDYNSTVEPKRTFLFNLVRDLRARGIPVDGVGHQMHSNIDFPSPQSLRDTINLFSTLGVDNQITEMDISVYTNFTEAILDYTQIPQDRFVRQGYLYRDYFQVLRQLKDKISSVTIWGLGDDGTWLTSSKRVDAPLLFDLRLQHKLAYLGIVDPLQLPGANLATAVNADSGTVLSGHTVNYTIMVTNNGHDSANNVVLTDVLPSGATFQSITAPPSWSCVTPAMGSTGPLSCSTATMNNGDAAQFVLALNVPCATSDGTTLMNSVSVTSSTRNPNPTPNTTAAVSVSVSNPPPAITGLSVDKPVLRASRSHGFVKVTLQYSLSDNCDTLTPMVSVTSNEQERPGERRRRPDVDWIVLDANHVLLEAENERTHGIGRTYTITVTTADSAGLSTSSSVNVVVRSRGDFDDRDRDDDDDRDDRR